MSRPYRDHTDAQLDAILAAPNVGERQKENVRQEKALRGGGVVVPKGNTPESQWAHEVQYGKPGPPEPEEEEWKLGHILLVIPWKHCVRDNAKYGVMNGRMILTKKYRTGKREAGKIAKRQMAGTPPFTTPVRLVAHVFFPNSSRKRDAGNYRKLLTDALEKGVYTDDSLIHDERWINAGVDADEPRVEIEITPLSQEE